MSNQLKIISEVPELPPRCRDGHKGDYGRVLILGGSADMSGSVALAARAALRSGAGLVTMAVPAAARAMAAVMCPCATSAALPDNERGFFAASAAAKALSLLEVCDVAAVGPGMGISTAGRMLVQRALAGGRPCVLDADGLNNLSAIDDWPSMLGCPLVLTPHPGEMARLAGVTIAEIENDRPNFTAAMARSWKSRSASPDQPLVLVLKGAGTVVSDGARCYVNTTGNPGMATGGSGDVLTGITAALIGQGMDIFDAAVKAVYMHGLAGDKAAAALSEISITAEDIITHLRGG